MTHTHKEKDRERRRSEWLTLSRLTWSTVHPVQRVMNAAAGVIMNLTPSVTTYETLSLIHI